MLSVYKIKTEPLPPSGAPAILAKKCEDLTDDEKPLHEEALKKQTDLDAKHQVGNGCTWTRTTDLGFIRAAL